MDEQTSAEGQASVAEEYDLLQRDMQSRQMAELNELLFSHTATMVEAECLLAYMAISLLASGWQPSPNIISYERARLAQAQALAAAAAAASVAAQGGQGR